MINHDFITLTKKAKDITGQRFGRLVALGPIGRTSQGKMVWLCRCDCGNFSKTALRNLQSGSTTSCGCYRLEIVRSAKVHGLHKSPVYNVWRHMIKRCTDPSCLAYPNYGQRGITVCYEWQNSLKSFHNHVLGLPNAEQEGYTLDRIDNNGNYEPGNMRWATITDQAKNRRSNINITFRDKTQCLSDWARELGIKPSTLAGRFHAGWSVENIILTPVSLYNKDK